MRMRGGELQSLKGLLDRYTHLAPPQGVVLEVFMRAVNALCGVNLARTKLTYKVHSRTVGIQGGGPLKSEIVLRRTEILALCRKELGEGNCPLHIV